MRCPTKNCKNKKNCTAINGRKYCWNCLETLEK